MKEEKTIDYIKTDDIDLASVLFHLGFSIDGIYASGAKTHFGKDIMQFYFRDEESLQKAMMDYHQRKLRVEPYELFNARKAILTKVRDEASIGKPKEKNR